MELNDKELKQSFERLAKARREWFPVRAESERLEAVTKKELENFNKLLAQRAKK
jgi:hypothetical protein